MKKLFMAAAAVCCLALASCGSYTMPLCATSNPVGNKCGEATYKMNGWGKNKDGGIEKAAKSAGITKISHVDVNVKSYGLFGMKKKYTTRVYGE